MKRPCLDCGTPTEGARCQNHRRLAENARSARRGTTTQRGLGAAHQQERQRMIDRAGPLSHCPRCGRSITAANPITGEHGQARAHGGTKVTELLCKICNSILGARIRRPDFFGGPTR